MKESWVKQKQPGDNTSFEETDEINFDINSKKCIFTDCSVTIYISVLIIIMWYYVDVITPCIYFTYSGMGL